MSRKQVEEPVDVTIQPNIFHQTFHDCPRCGHTWETKPAIPSVIHRTELCDPCKVKLGRNVETPTF